MSNFLALPTYIRNEERSQVNDLCFHFKKLKKENHIKYKVSRRNNIRIGISEIENRKIEKINETKCWSFKKINKIDKSLPYQKKGHKIKFANIKNERGDNIYRFSRYLKDNKGIQTQF